MKESFESFSQNAEESQEAAILRHYMDKARSAIEGKSLNAGATYESLLEAISKCGEENIASFKQEAMALVHQLPTAEIHNWIYGAEQVLESGNIPMAIQWLEQAKGAIVKWVDKGALEIKQVSAFEKRVHEIQERLDHTSNTSEQEATG